MLWKIFKKRGNDDNNEQLIGMSLPTIIRAYLHVQDGVQLRYHEKYRGNFRKIC